MLKFDTANHQIVRANAERTTPSNVAGNIFAVAVFLSFMAKFFQSTATVKWLKGFGKKPDAPAYSAIKNEDEIKKLKMLSCEKCGFTIFPAMGRVSQPNF